LEASIRWILRKHYNNIDAFSKALQQEGISLVVRRGKENVIYGLTYVDHKNRTVFNGSDLGKEYSAKAVTESFVQKDNKEVKSLVYHRTENIGQFQQEIKEGDWKMEQIFPEAKMPYEPIPYSMKIKKKQKKKRRVRF